MPDAPLECRDRRRIAAECTQDSLRLRGIGRTRAVAVCDDHPDIRSGDFCIRERECNRARRAVTVGAQVHDAGRLCHAAVAEKFAEHHRAARLRIVGFFQHHRRATFAENRPRALTIERSQHVRGEQPELVVAEHGFRLEQRVVPDGGDAIRLVRSQRLGGFCDGQHAARTLVGDARIRALEHVPDADMAEHVVRKIFQQPHRVHRRAKCRAEFPHVTARLGHQREVFVVAAVCAAARADHEAAAVVEERHRRGVERLAVSWYAGGFDRLAARVDAEKIRARNALMQLAILDELLVLHAVHARGDFHRPALGVPQRDRRHRRLTANHSGPDFLHSHARAADCARAGDGDAR